MTPLSAWLLEKRRLGRTELWAGRLGLGASYAAPPEAYEAAFDAGCNYFYWGALRSSKMALAVRRLTQRGQRDNLIVVLQDFRRSPRGLERSLVRGLKRIGLDHVDVLLLGWHNRIPKERIFEAAQSLREKGAFKALGISGHNRKMFVQLAGDPRCEIFHVRYNAANRGAEDDLFPHLPEPRPGLVSFTATRRMSLVNSRKIPKNERRPSAGDCYRYVLAHPQVDVVITAPANAAQMQQNLAEVAKGPLAPEEVAWMRRIGDHVYGRIRERGPGGEEEGIPGSEE